jgi:hypothetical protein
LQKKTLSVFIGKRQSSTVNPFWAEALQMTEQNIIGMEAVKGCRPADREAGIASGIRCNDRGASWSFRSSLHHLRRQAEAAHLLKRPTAARIRAYGRKQCHRIAEPLCVDRKIQWGSSQVLLFTKYVPENFANAHDLQ